MINGNKIRITISFGILVLSVIMIMPQYVSAARVMAIDTNTYSSIALCDDGSLISWGTQYKNGADKFAFQSYIPVLINVTDVKSASVSFSDIFILKNDGTVWAMGDNTYGQLGIGTFDQTPGIVKVEGLDNVTAISAGTIHVLALKNDGTVWAWGNNMDGEIGDGNIGKGQPTPVQVKNLENIVTVSAGYLMSVAISADGAVWTWGNNEHGELGDGTNTQKTLPARITIDNVTSIVSHEGTVIALKNDGTVWTWGCNNYGQLGYGKKLKDVYTPEQIKGLTGVVKIDTGITNSMAVKGDGSVWIWGQNQMGMFGNGQLYGTDSMTPVHIPGLKNITQIALGWSHAVALSDDGTVWAWGDNREGQIGNGETSEAVIRPLAVIKGTISIDNVDTYNGTSAQADRNNSSISPIPVTSQDSGPNYLGIIGIAGILLFIGIVAVINNLRKK